MNHKYESVIIARQDLGASQVSGIVSDLSNIIKKEGGEFSPPSFLF